MPREAGAAGALRHDLREAARHGLEGAGGMNAIVFNPDGNLTGAACWRADGISGGLARAGVRFTTL
jgi:hypothetical protein